MKKRLEDGRGRRRGCCEDERKRERKKSGGERRRERKRASLPFLPCAGPRAPGSGPWPPLHRQGKARRAAGAEGRKSVFHPVIKTWAHNRSFFIGGI